MRRTHNNKGLLVASKVINYMESRRDPEPGALLTRYHISSSEYL